MPKLIRIKILSLYPKLLVFLSELIRQAKAICMLNFIPRVLYDSAYSIILAKVFKSYDDDCDVICCLFEQRKSH